MKFIEYCNLRIKEILARISEIELNSTKSISSINDYQGTKKELLKEYYKQKGKKIKNYIFKPSEQELVSYINNLKLNKLKKEKEELNEELEQLLKASKSFEDDKFQSEIFPNNYIIKNIIIFASQSNTPIEIILNMLISLFKNNPLNNTNIILEIENRISNSFNSDNEISPELNPTIVNFLLEKLLHLSLTNEEKIKYSISINNLQNEVSLRHNNPTISKEERKNLEMKKSSIAELQKYISGEKIITTTPTIEYFEMLLNIADIPRLQAMKYIKEMSALIDIETEKINNTVLQNFLSVNELEIYREAKYLENNISIPSLKAILKRYLKDVTSMCRYISQICPPEELHIAYESLSNKIYTIKLLVKNIKDYQISENTTSYLTDSEDFPIILRNLENLDIILFPEVYNLIKKLEEKKAVHTKTNSINGVDIYSLSGEHITLIYTKNNKNTVVIGLLNSKEEQKYINFNKAHIEKLYQLLKSNKSEQQKITESICGNLINSTLTCEISRELEGDFKELKKD